MIRFDDSFVYQNTKTNDSEKILTKKVRYINFVLRLHSTKNEFEETMEELAEDIQRNAELFASEGLSESTDSASQSQLYKDQFGKVRDVSRAL